MNSTVQVRIDTKTKDQAQAILKRLGLDISSGVKVFLRQVIETNSLPFPVRTGNGLTPTYEKALLADRTHLHASVVRKGMHKNARSLFKELGV